jgi:restriction system protein
MSRKKKPTAADDLIAIIAFLPWWLGVALAIVFYFLLHSMALTEVSMVAGDTGQMGQFAVDSFKKQLASIGQYLVPALCLIGAVVSALRRRARARLIDNVIKGDSSTGLKGMSWQEFEQVVGEAFRLRGYSVIENGGGGADGGVDLILKKGGEKFIVQCKQWRALKVGVTVVRELYGVMAADGASGGFVVTCGRFTDEARAFANGRNVTLVDGSELEKLIREASGRAKSIPTSPVPQTTLGIAGPQCPTCGSAMVERTAKRGASAGNRFWGCVAYPSCKGTAPAK